MYTNGNDERRGRRMRTREEILADLRQTQIGLDCSVDEARAVIAVEVVERIHDRVEDVAERLGDLLTGFVLSRYSGETQASAQLKNTLVKLGLVKGNK